jgi:mitochondrial fission protein ELM1
MVRVWALTDHRKGTANQVLGVAKHTGYHVVEKQLTYTNVARLPNRLQLLFGMRGITKVSRASLTPPYPDVIISAGRRAAAVALLLKKQHPALKLVQIMSPELPLSSFDLVVLPAHDFPPEQANIIKMIGAPHCITDALLKEAASKHPLGHFTLAKPWTMICLGGNTSFGRFTLQDVKKLIDDLKPLAQEGGALLITASRRTPHAVFHMMLEWTRQAYPDIEIKSYAPDSGGENPYYAWLAQADRIVISADSVSMISEAAFTLKPIYIFNPEQAAGRKHLHFVMTMIDEGHVKPLRDYRAEWRRYVNVNEAARVGYAVRALCGDGGDDYEQSNSKN